MIYNILPEFLLSLYVLCTLTIKAAFDIKVNSSRILIPIFLLCFVNVNFLTSHSDFFSYKYFESLFKTVILFAGFIICVFMQRNFERQLLVLFSVIGATAVISATNFWTLLFSIELSVLPTYFLVFSKEFFCVNRIHTYFTYNSISSAIMAFAVCFLCVTTESANFSDVKSILLNAASFKAHLASFLILIPLIIKLGVFSCHAWVVDLAEKKTEDITPVFCITKIALMIACYKTIVSVLYGSHITNVLLVLSCCSMLFGSAMVALQNNFKKIIAYISVYHAGVILMCASLKTYQGEQGFVFFIVSEIISLLGLFILISQIKKPNFQGIEFIRDINSLAEKYPALGIAATCILLSLIGFPPLVGFWGKFFICVASIECGFLIPAAIYVMSSIFILICAVKILRAIWFSRDCFTLSIDSATIKLIYFLAFLTVAVIPFANKLSALMRLEGYFVQ